MVSKEEESKVNRAVSDEEALPPYETVDASGSVPVNDPPTSTFPPEPAPLPAKHSESNEKRQGPTSESPFNFPSNVPPPGYSAGSSSSSRQPIAVPQSDPNPTSRFICAYPSVLLRNGITQQTWRSFLETLSAFLTAKVSDRAISHAGDIAKKLSQGPENLVKDVYSHTKDVGRNIGNNAKRGNVLGAAMGVVGGAISIPLSAAFGTVRTVVGLPGSTVTAVAKKPKTPRERAAAYLAVANRDWFESRGLHARLLDTQELCESVGVSSENVLETARASKDETAEGQLLGLHGYVANLEFWDQTFLKLGDKTLWVVLVPNYTR
ncbi:Fc.00g072880.m01.CDS01 [Cosmosporella sp. VM-42]